jgi:hypothetical protein
MADFSVIIQTPTFRQLVQENMLDRMFHDALFPKQMFRAEAEDEKWQANEGDTKVFTGKGLMGVDLRPLAPRQDPQPNDYGAEQWTALMQKWANSIDTNLATATLTPVKKLTEDLKSLGLNAGQTLNYLVRLRLFNAAEAGWTVADGVSTTTTLRVKRLNGFTRARRPDLSTGSPVRYDLVTTNNPLPITVVRTVGGAIDVNVTGFTPDTAGDEVGPGTLTISSAITVADRDAVYAVSRTFMVRSGGGLTVDALSGGTDILHLLEIRQAVERLRTSNVPEFGDGSFHMHVDPKGEGQLFADNEFQRLHESLPEGMAYKDFVIKRVLGCIVLRNNENPVVENVAGGSTLTFSQKDPIAGELRVGGSTSGAKIHRALVIGAEALKEYWFDQNEMITEAGVSGRIENGARVVNNGVEMTVERIQVIMRAPQDRLQENVAQTWKYSGDFVVRTDGATGDQAAHKRLITIQHTE